MSTPRFASITASLLARKGEAQPWSNPNKQPLAWDGTLPPPELPPRSDLPPVAATPSRPADLPRATDLLRRSEPARGARRETAASDALKKCTVRMSHYDHERLGILAVKQGKTRQRLLQEAVDALLSGITKAFGPGCACLKEEQQPGS